MLGLGLSGGRADAAGCHAVDRPVFGLNDPWEIASAEELGSAAPPRVAVIDRVPCSQGQPLQAATATLAQDHPALTTAAPWALPSPCRWRRLDRTTERPVLAFPSRLDRPPRVSAG